MDTDSEIRAEESITQYPENDFKTNTVIQGFNGVNPPTTLIHSVPADVYNIPLPPTTEYNNQLVLNENTLEHEEHVQMDYEVTSQSDQVSQDTPVEQSDRNNGQETSVQHVELDSASSEVKADVSISSETIIYDNTEETSSIVSSVIVGEAETSIAETTFESTSDKSTEDSAQIQVETIHSDSKVSSAETVNVPEYMEVPSEDITVFKDENVNTPAEHEIQEEIIEESIQSDEIHSDDTAVVSTTDGHVQYTVLPPGENSVYQEDGTLVVEYPLHHGVEVAEETIHEDTVHEVEMHEESIHNEVEMHEESIQNEVEMHEESIHNEVEIHEEILSNEVEVSHESQELTSLESTTENTEVPVKEEKSAPKPKGRKHATYIPLHIMGHDINKPVQDVPNGKPTLKPRLGVKIPYRNLASQIVSTTELQQQIVERARQKQEAQSQADVSNSFAKKLTHRLAQSLSGLGKSIIPKKEVVETKIKTDLPKVNTFSSIVDIAPLSVGEKVSSNDQNLQEIVIITSDENTSSSRNENVIEFVEQTSDETIDMTQNDVENSSFLTEHASNRSIDTVESNEEISEILIESESEKPTLKIESNSDLIAILEGDGDEGASIVAISKPVKGDSSDSSSEMKDIEKEVSLREQKNPQPIKGKKFFKTGDSRTAEAAKIRHEASKLKESTQNKEAKITSSSPSTNPKNDDSKIHSSSKNDNPKSSCSKTAVSEVRKTFMKDKERDKAKSTTSERRGLGTVVEVEPQLKPAMVLKTYTRKRKSNDAPMPEPPKKLSVPESILPELPESKNDFTLPIPPNAYVTKSSRVIKRKVIWDPDEAMPTVRNQSKILSKIEATSKNQSASKATPPKSLEKKTVVKDKQVDSPKTLKPVEKKVTKSATDEKETEKPVLRKMEKVELNKTKGPIIVKSTTIVKSPNVGKSSPIPKAAASPSGSNESISTGKSPKQRSSKRLTEIDKLLMDEGAVNMLYDINNSDDQKRRGSTRISVTSTDKAQTQKELLNRTQEIKNELTQGTTVEVAAPKNLRKKEGSATPKKDKEMVRKMSKDSSKSSTHSPPPSPAAFTLAEASRIIRRHSSSSFSTDDELVHETLADEDEKIKDKEKQVKKMPPPTPVASSTIVETVPPEKPTKERVKKKAEETPDVQPKKKQKKENLVPQDEEPRKPVEITIKSEPGIITGELKTDPSRTFTLIKMNKHYMINLTYSGGDNYLTVQLLKDLTVTLKELGKNKNCNVVSIHSQGSSFCLGIDYKGLVESNEELRKKRATELSTCIRDFMKCLLNFPKVIVAGVKGDCVGFGVTMLPLFDMVLASDSASFCTPYGKLGCAPEGGFLLANPFQSNNGLASELLYTTHKMNADDAYRRGLVTKLFWPEKFDTEFRALLLHISNLSKAGLTATKKQLRFQHCQSAENALVNNSRVLIQLWTSEECQKNFVNYNALTFQDQ